MQKLTANQEILSSCCCKSSKSKILTPISEISLSFEVDGRHCHETGQIRCFIVKPMDISVKVADTGKSRWLFLPAVASLRKHCDIPVVGALEAS